MTCNYLVRSIPSLAAIFLLIGCPCSVAMAQKPVRVRLVDGRTGKPIETKRVRLVSDNNSETLTYLTTASDGSLDASFKTSNSLVMVSDVCHYRCDVMKQDAYSSYSIQEILDHGIVSANNCGSIHEQPIKGELVVYLRKLTAREKFRAVAMGLLICG